MAEFGIPLGLTTTACLAACAVTAGILATDQSHPMVAQEMQSMAAGLGLTGVLAGGYTFLAGVLCQRLTEKLDFRDRKAEMNIAELAGQAMGARDQDPQAVIAGILADPRKAEIMSELVAGTKMESRFSEMAQEAGIGGTSHRGVCAGVEYESGDARMAMN